MNYNRNHRVILYLFFYMLMVVFAACAREKQEGITETSKTDTIAAQQTPAAQPLNSVTGIQAAYTAIVSKLNRGVLDSTSFKYSCNDEKRGTISYFSESGKLRLIIHRWAEYDHFEAEDRYFVKDSTLFFAYTKTVTWSFESGPEGSTKDNITEKRIYLVNEQPIKCLEKKFVIHSKASNNPSSASIPNKDVSCASAKLIMRPYFQLMKFRGKPTTDCLD